MKEKTIREFKYPTGERPVCKETCGCRECTYRIKCLHSLSASLWSKLITRQKHWKYLKMIECCDGLGGYTGHPKLTEEEFMVVVHNVAILYLLGDTE